MTRAEFCALIEQRLRNTETTNSQWLQLAELLADVRQWTWSKTNKRSVKAGKSEPKVGTPHSAIDEQVRKLEAQREE